MTGRRHPGPAAPRARAGALALALLLPGVLLAEIGLRLRAPPSDRTGFLSREWIRAVGRPFTSARDLLAGRSVPTPPTGPEMTALATALTQPPSLCAAYSPAGAVAWALGADAPAPPEGLAPGLFRLGWQIPAGNSALLWIPPRAPEAPLGWHCLELDLVRLLSDAVPSNHLAGTEALVAWRAEPLAPLAGFAAAGGRPWLLDAEHLRRRGGVKSLLEQMGRQERGVFTFPRFTSDESHLVHARVEWFPLVLSGLPLVATLETEQPFVGKVRDTTGAWRRVEPDSREAFDLLEEGTGWILRGRDAWEGVRLEGRSLEGVYSASRFEVRAGLPGLNSFSARLQEDGILVADVYQIREKAMHHFVYRFSRTGPFVVDPDNELPLKTQVR